MWESIVSGRGGYQIKDLSETRFNRWLVLERDQNIYRGPSGQIKTYWHCRCDCGTFKKVYQNSLTSGKSKSCGCLRKETLSKPVGDSSRHAAYMNYVAHAKKLKIVMRITEDMFSTMSQRDCFYCGAVPGNIAQSPKRNGSYTYNGLDRKDSSKGYTEDNVVTACRNCNLAKRRLSYQEFMSLIKKIYERHYEWTPSFTA